MFRVSAQLMGLLAVVLLVRVLTEYEYGVYNLLYSLIGLVSVVLSFGIANTLQRYIPEYYGRGEYYLANKLFRTSALIRLFANVLAIAAVLAFWESLAPLLKIEGYKGYFSIFSVIVLLHLQRNILEICLNSYFLQKYSQGAALVFTIIKSVGYAISLYEGYSLWGILIVDILAYVIVFAGLQSVYSRLIPKQEGGKRKFDRAERRRIVRYALFYNFNDAGIGLLGTDIDNYIIALFLNPVAVGGYAFSHRITKTIVSLSPLVYLIDVIRPLFFFRGADATVEQVQRAYRILVKFSAIFYLPALLFLALYIESILITVFGGKFIEYKWIVVAQFFFLTLNSFQLPLGLVVQLRERADIVLYSKFFGIYNLVAALILIPWLGIWGAVIATGTAILLKNVFILYFVRQDANFSGTSQFFIRLTAFWMLIYCIGAGASHVIGDAFMSLVFGTMLFSVAFFLQFMVMHFNEDEVQMLDNVANESDKVRRAFSLLRLQGYR